MVGILCEKSSAARNFAKALGGIKGTYGGTPYLIVNARGHLFEFAQPDDMVDSDKKARYKSWTVNNLPWNETDFNWKRIRKKGTSDILKEIKSGLSGCDEIVIATDVDPTGEGELLAYEIIEELKLQKKKISRMYFIDETVPEVQKAFKTRKTIPDFYSNPDYVKALYRVKFDFLTMQFTRIATACGDGKSVIRQGRLKSAMVSIVGDGLAAIASYKKIPFYSNRFKDENGNIFTNPDEPTFPDKAQVPACYKPSAVVVRDIERKSKAPKKLLDLATLSALLAPKGYKAKQVLDVYQQMYEAQIVSYPRTEDKVISPEQFNDLLPFVDKIASVVGVDKSLLTHRTPRATHVKSGGAHGANRPGPNVPDKLSDLSSYGACGIDIYVLIAKSYLSMLAEDYIYDSEQGYLELYPDFKASVSIPVSMGWKAVFNDKDDDDDTEGQHLGKMATPFVHEGFPPKPPTPTMKWLMAQLAKRDVGTGATRTSTYAEVTSEKSKFPLLIDKKGKITMAECGEISYKLLPRTHIGSIALTEEMQCDMRNIAAGKVDPDRCLAKIAGYVVDDLKTMTANGQAITKKAGNDMAFTTKEKYEGIWNGKTVKFTRVWSGHRFTDDECEALLRGEEIEVHGLVSAKGSTYGVKGKLSEQEYNGNKFVGFERTGFASNSGENGIPNAWCGHTFTSDEKAKLEAGEEIYVENLVSRKNPEKTFSAKLVYDKTKSCITPLFD